MTNSLYRQILQRRQDLFNAALADGIYTPFLLPWDLVPVVLLAIGIIATPRLPRYAAIFCRWLLTLSSFMYMAARWPYARTVGFTSGYGIGLAGFWGLIMTVNLLVLHDPGKDFRRIEARRPPKNAEPAASYVNGEIDNTQRVTLRSRQNHRHDHDHAHAHEPAAIETATSLVWQSRPEEFWHLVDWSTDLMTSFRGMNWNFRIPAKTHVIHPPEGNPPTLNAEAEIANKGAMKRLQRSAIRNFLCYYILIDLLKTFMVTDPYFLGIVPLESPTPWPWLAKLNESIPIATRFVRLSVCLTSVVSALTLIFSLNPLFFGAVLPYLLGDKLYPITKSPLLEVWMYPAQWGSMFESLCSKGLAGMWGNWWHQMFRHGISEPSRLLVKKLGISPKSQTARLIQLSIAFGLTASIHAVASSTTFSMIPSRPWNPFIFFMSQAVGIAVQTEASERLNRWMKFSKSIRRFGNFAFSFTFLWYVGPFLSDDFSRCQIWLFEPVPVSIFRGLGFGPGDCWVPWLQFADGGRWFDWWNRGYLRGIGIY